MAASPDAMDALFLQDIPIELVVELGRTRLTVKELAALGRDDVIELDRAASQPLDILVGGRVFARGEIVVVDDRVGLRITALTGSSHDGGR
ncbi:MAG: flagellar motor switch protein FliN [Myxococcales bacterium]|nr:flagellar motor switch protein FliN [Myxococcales bacterium]